jgi:hypothetical protein
MRIPRTVTNHDADLPASGIDAVVYPPVWRMASAALVVLAAAGFPLLLAVAMYPDRPILPVTVRRAVVPLVTALGIPPAPEFRVFFLAAFAIVLIVVPAAAAWFIQRAFAARVEFRGETLTIDRRELRVEVPGAAIARATPWIIPLPGSGFWLVLQSGRRLRYGLQMADAIRFLETLASARGLPRSEPWLV